MPFQPGNPGKPKGAKNKVGMAAKAVIAEAAEALGGTKRLVEWAQEAPENEKAFWATIYPKLIPHEVTGADGGGLVLQIVKYADDTPAE